VFTEDTLNRNPGIYPIKGSIPAGIDNRLRDGVQIKSFLFNKHPFLRLSAAFKHLINLENLQFMQRVSLYINVYKAFKSHPEVGLVSVKGNNGNTDFFPASRRAWVAPSAMLSFSA
jgi:hypothetical protein